MTEKAKLCPMIDYFVYSDINNCSNVTRHPMGKCIEAPAWSFTGPFCETGKGNTSVKIGIPAITSTER